MTKKALLILPFCLLLSFAHQFAEAESQHPDVYIIPHEADGITFVRFIPGRSQRILVGFTREPDRIWDLYEGTSIRAFGSEPVSGIFALALSEDGKYWFKAGSTSSPGGASAFYGTTRDGLTISLTEVSPSNVSAASFGRNSRSLLIGTLDGRVVRFDRSSGIFKYANEYSLGNARINSIYSLNNDSFLADIGNNFKLVTRETQVNVAGPNQVIKGHRYEDSKLVLIGDQSEFVYDESSQKFRLLQSLPIVVDGDLLDANSEQVAFHNNRGLILSQSGNIALPRSQAIDVSLSHELVVAGSWEGDMNLFDLTGERIATIVHSGSRWIVIDPDGRFDSYDLSWRNTVEWGYKGRFLPFDTLVRERYEPNLLNKLRRGANLTPLTRINQNIAVRSVQPARSSRGNLRATTSTSRKPRTFLVNIGIGSYETDAWTLNYAAQDALLMRQGFTESLASLDISPTSIVLLSDEKKMNATKPAIEQLFTELAREIQVSDRLILTFSGHADVADDGEFYLLTSNTGGKEALDEGLKAQMISSGELADWLEAISTSSILVVFDTCKSSGVMGTVETLSFGQTSSFRNVAASKGMIVLAASRSQYLAAERGELEHGVLSFALAKEGLLARKADPSNSGRISLRDLMDWTVARVPTLNREIDAGLFYDDTGVKITFKTTNPASAPQDPPSYDQRPVLFDFAGGSHECYYPLYEDVGKPQPNCRRPMPPTILTDRKCLTC